MIRYDCFEWLAPQMTDQLVVTSLSGQRVEWGHLSKRDADLNLGSMGNALAVGIGLALALPRRKVFVFESDGSVLLVVVQFADVGQLEPAQHGSVRVRQPGLQRDEDQPSERDRRQDRSWRQWPKVRVLTHAVTVSELEDFKKEATAALNQSGLRFVVCKIEESVGHRKIIRTNVDLLETKYRFVRYLERTEGKPIIQGRG